MSTSLLYHAYGLKGVKYNSTEYKRGSVIFHGEVTSSVECCTVCGSWKTVRRKGSKLRVFRMIPIDSRQVLLVLKIWRIRCQECGSLRWPRLPFVKGKRRYTRRFARFAIDLLHRMTISGVAKVLSVGWDLIKDLDKEYLQRKYKVPLLKDLKYLGIDEFSIRKGHSYMSIFVDLETGRILHAVEGKSGKDIEPFLKVLKRKAPKLKAIAMDMNTSFISALEQDLPFIPIVFDRYHVLALMNKAIEEVRRGAASSA